MFCDMFFNLPQISLFSSRRREIRDISRNFAKFLIFDKFMFPKYYTPELIFRRRREISRNFAKFLIFDKFMFPKYYTPELIFRRRREISRNFAKFLIFDKFMFPKYYTPELIFRIFAKFLSDKRKLVSALPLFFS